MTDIVKVYGFGSYFARSRYPRDLDLLLVHASIKKRSCEHAIECKAIILQKIPDGHITLLSVNEEMLAGFIRRSGAVILGSVSEESTEVDARSICEAIVRYRAKTRPT